MEFSDSTEPTATDTVGQPTTRRGRPRSEETIQRDEVILKALGNGPRTKEQLAQDLGLKDTHVYLSLWRLRRDAKVEKVTDGDVRHLWRVTA
jgi:predicted Rossmann fold nucleotide-binding protein DprA/Smf involved in DNA uptake